MERIVQGLQGGEKNIPFDLLYDSRGSDLYKKITELDSYYLFEAEKTVFMQHSYEIAQHILPDTLVVELGCGIADKTVLLLEAIQATHPRCQYVGIDVSKTALEEAREVINNTKEGIEMELVQADYMEGLRVVRNKYPDKVMCILWLGSSVGNLSVLQCNQFARDVIQIVGSRCQFFLCVDMWKDESTLLAAYNDEQGISGSFIKNGMKHGLEILGYGVSDDDMLYEVDINSKSHQVEMYVRFKHQVSLPQHQIVIRENERVLVEISRKFTNEDVLQFASETGFVCHARWGTKAYGCYMLLSCEEALLRCWRDTDKLFKGVSDWLSQPIPYRHPFCFYYGHMVAFAKTRLLINDESTSDLDHTFSRGIDPIVLDPTRCHSHPEPPRQWPDKESMKKYVEIGRSRMIEYIKTGNVDMERLNLVLEHERMHQETLTYMLVQQRKLSFENHPTPVTRSELNGTWKLYPKKPGVLIPGGNVVLGVDPTPGVFRLDNEKPSYVTKVKQEFRVSSNPVSIGEFMSFVKERGYVNPEFWRADDFEVISKTSRRIPSTWSYVRGEYFVHFVDRTVRWLEVSSMPVYVSLAEAEAYCKWVGARVMTEAEYQRVLDEAGDTGKVKSLRDGGWEWTSSEFAPFPGFVKMEAYPEYSTDFFDGLHYVLKGSSPVTHISMLRDEFRNFYQRQYPYVFAKFRLCK